MKKTTIRVKDLQKIIHLNASDIPRLKGRQDLPHLGRKVLRPLLSYDSGILTFDDLKLYTIYVLVTKNNRTLKTDERIDIVFDSLEKNNNNIDGVYKDFILKNIEKIGIKKEELFSKFNFEIALEVLKQLCPLKIEPYYSSPDFFNLKSGKEKIKMNEDNLNKNKLLVEENIENYDYNNILDYIYKKYSQKEKGFFPFQFPTGNGKTFYLENFLVNQLIESYEELEKTKNFKNLKHDKIIVITSNKVNVNEIYRNIGYKLIKAGKEDCLKFVFQMKAIKDILNNEEFLKKMLMELDEPLCFYEKLPYNFIKNMKQELKKLLMYIEQKSLREDDFDKFNSTFLFEIRKQMFKYYRLLLKKELNEEVEVEKIVLPNFVKELYPMILPENINKKIYIMTTDKFLYGYVGQTETKYFHQETGNLIFIDEIDSSKSNFLKYIENTRTLIIKDIVNSFNEIFNSFSKLTNNSIPSMFERLKNVKDNIIGELEKVNKKSEIDKLLSAEASAEKQKELMEIKGDKLRKNFRTELYVEMKEEIKEIVYLFQDEYYHFADAKSRYYLDIINNNIFLTKKRTNLSLDGMLKALFSYIYKNFNFFLLSLYKYHVCLKIENELEKEIISHFFYNRETQKKLSDEFRKFIIERILLLGEKDKTKREKNFNLKNTFFQIEELNPQYQLNKRVIIGSQTMYTTPEALLYLISLNNLVFGISATATQETCIGNFDLKWLRTQLSSKFYSLEYYERKKLKETLKKINNFENQVERKLNVYQGDEIIKTGFDNVEELKKDKRMINKLINIRRKAFKAENYSEENRNIQEEYYNYAFNVILNFLLDKKSNSLLFISNRFTQADMIANLIINLKNFLKDKNLLTKNVVFRDLNARSLNHFLENKEEIDNELMNFLKNPKIKTIIFTTYQSAGTGVNIKFARDNFDNNQLVELDKDLQEKLNIPLIYKDIDDIALESKTHLMEFDETRKYFLIELMYYSNLMADNNIIEKKYRPLLLKEASEIKFVSIYKKSYDFVENGVGKMIQAIGRANRTKVRNKFRNIYLDNNAFNLFQEFEPRDREYIGDIYFILDEVKKLKKSEDISEIVDKVIFQNKRTILYWKETFLQEINKYNNLIRYTTIEKDRNIYIKKLEELAQSYEEFRLYVVQNPTRSKNTIKNPAYFSIGKKIDGYEIHTGKNSEEINNILFDTNKKNISFEKARLKEIFKIRELRDFCEMNVGMFTENDEIITPYTYQAIFIGKVGELLLEEIFRMNEIKLKDKKFMIKNGIFETFDDCSENGMWIDFKNYNLDNVGQFDYNKGLIESVVRKEKLISKENKLFYINLISPNLENLGQRIFCWKIKDIEEETKKTCSYEESEVVTVSGLIKYSEDRKSLELDTYVIKEIKKMLGGKDE